MNQIVSAAGVMFNYGIQGVQTVATTIAGDSTGLLMVPIAIGLSTIAISLFRRLAHIFN